MRKVMVILCVLGWLAAIISFPYLPDVIPVQFGNGQPSAFSGKISVFLWPILQMAIAYFGARRTMLPNQLKEILNDSQYDWTICGILVFGLFLELVIIWASLCA